MYYCPQCRYPTKRQGMCPHHWVQTVPPEELPPDESPEDLPHAPPVFPKSDYGVPNVIGDQLHGKVMDYAAGQVFDSRSERRRRYKELGLQRMSVGEARQHGIVGDHPSPTKKHIIPGVKKSQKLPWHKQIQ